LVSQHRGWKKKTSEGKEVRVQLEGSLDKGRKGVVSLRLTYKRGGTAVGRGHRKTVGFREKIIAEDRVWEKARMLTDTMMARDVGRLDKKGGNPSGGLKETRIINHFKRKGRKRGRRAVCLGEG